MKHPENPSNLGSCHADSQNESTERLSENPEKLMNTNPADGGDGLSDAPDVQAQSQNGGVIRTSDYGPGDSSGLLEKTGAAEN